MNSEPTIYVAARLPKSLVERLDAYAADHEQPGMVVTRSDAVRMLLLRGLDAEGRCCATHGEHVCTLHKGHKGTHYDSHKDKSWSAGRAK